MASNATSASGLTDEPKSPPAVEIDCASPSKIAPLAKSQYKDNARNASSLPGIGKSMPSGFEFESRTAITGIFNTFASAIANASLFVSKITIASGALPISLIPPSVRDNLVFSFSKERTSFLVKPSIPSAKIFSKSLRRLIELETVFQFVNMPPNQR